MTILLPSRLLFLLHVDQNRWLAELADCWSKHVITIWDGRYDLDATRSPLPFRCGFCFLDSWVFQHSMSDNAMPTLFATNVPKPTCLLAVVMVGNLGSLLCSQAGRGAISKRCLMPALASCCPLHHHSEPDIRANLMPAAAVRCIAISTNQSGVPSPMGGKWQVTVSQMLQACHDSECGLRGHRAWSIT